MKIYKQYANEIKEFNKIIDQEKVIGNQNDIVGQLLPMHIYDKLRNTNITNKINLTDSFENCTMLFADIVNFTKYSASVTPQQVVKMLTELFKEFDKKVCHYNLYKVYTIGDCYVAMGFQNLYKRDPVQEAINMVNFGFEMIEIIKNVREIINFHELNMRIGIHTGNIIGGVIGTEIVRYDIYGQDVLIANKMESNGESGHVMVSETTKQLIFSQKQQQVEFNFIKHTDIFVQAANISIAGYLVENFQESASAKIASSKQQELTQQLESQQNQSDSNQ